MRTPPGHSDGRRSSRRLWEIAIAAVALTGVAALPFVLRPEPPSPPKAPYRQVAGQAAALIESRIVALQSAEQTDEWEQVPEARQEEFNEDVEQAVTELVATVEPPQVELDETAAAVTEHVSIDTPEYDRQGGRWTFFLRFNVGRHVHAQRHGFRFKAYDETGHILVSDELRLLAGAEPGGRVVAAIVVEDRDGHEDVLERIALFRISYVEQSEFVPGNGRAVPFQGTGGFGPGSTTGSRLRSIRPFGGGSGSTTGGGTFVPVH